MVGWSIAQRMRSSSARTSAAGITRSWCSAPTASATARAKGASLNSVSSKAIEHVRIGPDVTVRMRVTTALESSPPLRKAPSGASLTRWLRTASARSARTSPTGSEATGRSTASPDRRQ